MGKADLHIHTIHSWDAASTVPAVLKQASDTAHLDVIAITDHNEIAGALEALELAPRYGIEVVPGSDINTAQGHLLALYIHHKIPAGLSLVETVLEVGRQGGLCIAAHPTARGCSSLTGAAIRAAVSIPEIARVLVAVETFNAGIINRRGNKNAQAIAMQLPLARTGSSDSHFVWTIGNGASLFKGHTSADLRRALEQRDTEPYAGPLVSTPSLMLAYVRSTLLRKASWVECNFRPSEPVTLGRLSMAQSAALGGRLSG